MYRLRKDPTPLGGPSILSGGVAQGLRRDPMCALALAFSASRGIPDFLGSLGIFRKCVVQRLRRDPLCTFALVFSAGGDSLDSVEGNLLREGDNSALGGCAPNTQPAHGWQTLKDAATSVFRVDLPCALIFLSQNSLPISRFWC